MDVDHILDGIGAIEGHGGVADTVFLAPSDLTSLRKSKASTSVIYILNSDLQGPGAERVGGAQLIPTNGLEAGNAVVCMARYITLAIRKDASVDFSSDANFSSDATTTRVVMRVDWAPSDPNAFYLIAP